MKLKEIEDLRHNINNPLTIISLEAKDNQVIQGQVKRIFLYLEGLKESESKEEAKK